ncbi:phosphoglycerate mutase [Pseudomonas syringae]|nr:phosphoglycerate mutase [Pseudomonas syringae]MCF5067754.1 phosphoglycerate mutase [Pseudomonas syringae]
MQATRLTLICHARTVAQKLSRFPTNEGIEDFPLVAGSLGRWLKTSSRLLCGPERRTRQTAELFGPDAQIVDALRDCDWGRWHGQSIKDLQRKDAQALQAWLADPDCAPHGGESVTQLGARAVAWLTSLQTTPGHIVAITHPFFMRAVLMQVVQGAAFNNVDFEPLATIELRFTGQWRLRLPGLDTLGVS